ncbi:MAG: nucleotide exchange factor GrpE [Candidatus Anammoxibacter sp.]
MDTEDKKIDDIEEKSEESENLEIPKTEAEEVNESPSGEDDQKNDEGNETTEECEIIDAVENEAVESEAVENESIDVDKKDDDDDDEETELTKEELKEIIDKSAERDDLLDKLQRLKAEYANFQKRKSKEIGEIRRYAIQNFVIDLTSVLDNFTRAVQSTEGSNDFDKLLEGIQLVESQFYKTLEDHDVKPIETVGKPFDPVMHEAVIEEEDDNQPHHTVIMELQKGYLLHDRIIRPAKVKVSKKSEENKEEDVEEEDANEEAKDIEE